MDDHLTTTRYIDADQINKLDTIRRQLFGNGSSLDPDERRDMANLLDLILDDLRDQVI